MTAELSCTLHKEPRLFHLKTGTKNPTTKGLTFFVCGEPNCEERNLLPNYQIRECAVHKGNAVELQTFEKRCHFKTRKNEYSLSYQCPMSGKESWCGTMDGSIPLNFWTNHTSKIKSPLIDEFCLDFGSDFFTAKSSTPCNQPPKKNDEKSLTSDSKIDEAVDLRKNLFLANFENSSSFLSSKTSNDTNKVTDDASSDLRETNGESGNAVNSMSVNFREKNSIRFVDPMIEESADSSHSTDYENTDAQKIVVDESSSFSQLAAAAAPRRSSAIGLGQFRIHGAHQILSSSSSSSAGGSFSDNADEATCSTKNQPIGGSTVARNDIKRQSSMYDVITIDQSSEMVQNSARLSPENFDRKQPELHGYLSKNPIESSADDNDVTCETSTSDVALKLPLISLAVPPRTDNDDTSAKVDGRRSPLCRRPKGRVADSSSSSQLFEADSSLAGGVSFENDAPLSDVKTRGVDVTSGKRKILLDSLKNLKAAQAGAHKLPDKGKRLQLKISEINKQLRQMDDPKSNVVKPLEDRPHEIAAKTDALTDQLTDLKLKENVQRLYPFTPHNGRSSPDSHDPSLADWRLTDERLMHLYATDENQMPRLYGGQMNDARRIEVKVVTQEAIKMLHAALIQRPTETEEVGDPAALKVPLKTHQRQAVKWLQWRETQSPPGGILADDMGLGKTLTMISLVLVQRANKMVCDPKILAGTDLAPSRSTLVICPASILYEWKKEINQKVKAGYLNCLVYHGPKRDTSVAKLASYDFVITSYMTVASEVGTGENNAKKAENRKKKSAGPSVLLKIAWQRVILDEGHVIKNPKSLTSQACCRVPAGNRWVLTGTPIHNKLTDLYPLLKFLRFEPFDEWTVWRRWIENKSEQAKKRLNTIINGILLRRTKNQICSITGKAIIDLPPKLYETRNIELSALEKKVYDRLFLASKKQVADFIRQQEDKDAELVAVSRNLATQRDFGYKNPFQTHKKDANEKLGQNDDFYSRSHILVLLLRLRQACSHLAMMREAVDLSAFDDLDDADNAADQLTQQLNDLTLFDAIDLESSDDASVQQLFLETFASTKIGVILKHVTEIKTSKNCMDKMVIVSQSTKLLDIFGRHLTTKGINFTSITGAVKSEERSRRVELFNEEGSGPLVLLLSLTAGGVGLNLVGGNHLFLMDLHWNPALEQQACDRIYRMGQKKSVWVHKFVCKNTIEEKVLALQRQKMDLAELVLTGAGDQRVNTLSLNDIKYLFEL